MSSPTDLNFSDMDKLIPEWAISEEDREFERLINNVSHTEFREILGGTPWIYNPYSTALIAAENPVIAAWIRDREILKLPPPAPSPPPQSSALIIPFSSAARSQTPHKIYKPAP